MVVGKQVFCHVTHFRTVTADWEPLWPCPPTSVNQYYGRKEDLRKQVLNIYSSIVGSGRKLKKPGCSLVKKCQRQAQNTHTEYYFSVIKNNGSDQHAWTGWKVHCTLLNVLKQIAESCLPMTHLGRRIKIAGKGNLKNEVFRAPSGRIRKGLGPGIFHTKR